MGYLKKLLQLEKGMTLLEALVSLLILGVVLTIVTSMLVHSFNIFSSAPDRMSAKQMGELNLREIVRYVRSSEAVSLENGGKIPENETHELKKEEEGIILEGVKLVDSDSLIITLNNNVLLLREYENGAEEIIESFQNVYEFIVSLENEDKANYKFTIIKCYDNCSERTHEININVQLRN